MDAKLSLGQASPGNLQAVEDLLFGNVDIVSAPIVMAIKVASTAGAAATGKARTKSVGVAFADTSVRELGVADFVDNDSFSNTEVSLFTLVIEKVLTQFSSRVLSFN